MNIEEMKKYWDTENQRTLYVIDEEAMNDMVLKKSTSAIRKGQIIEDFILWMNIIVPVVLLFLLYINKEHNVATYLTSAFMFLAAAFISYSQNKRKKEIRSQGDTVLAHLDVAIENATYTARLTNYLLKWYIVIIGIGSCLTLYFSGAQWYFMVAIIIVFIIAFFVGRWEQRAWHDKRRDDLIALKEKVLSDL